MPKHKPVPKQKKLALAKSDPKSPIHALKLGKKSVVPSFTKVQADSEVAARPAKPVLLKLPRTVKKAARACAKAQGLKLRVWIVELIKIQLSKESAITPTKSIQTA
jgi:hypothetical protein